jgi:hypothetical protein
MPQALLFETSFSSCHPHRFVLALKARRTLVPAAGKARSIAVQ